MSEAVRFARRIRKPTRLRVQLCPAEAQSTDRVLIFLTNENFLASPVAFEASPSLITFAFIFAEHHMSTLDRTALAEMTSEVVSAYVTRNSVRPTDMPALISTVHETLSGLGQPPATAAAAEPLKPAVPIKKSVTDEYIISLEDGRKLKSMKRYLAGLGMTPADYRAKWGLPSDYPTVAPAYAKARSKLARSLGLGRKRREEAVEADPEPQVQPGVPKKPRRGGGKRA